MVRIKKFSNDPPKTTPNSADDKPNNKTGAKATAGDGNQDAQSGSTTPGEEAKKQDTASSGASSASPFGFASTGSGMASGILGIQPGEGGNENHGSSQRDSESAAVARRARRQRADLPPLEDEPRVKAAKYISTGLLFGLLIAGVVTQGTPYSKKELERGLKDDPEQGALQQFWSRVVKRTVNKFTFFSAPATEKLLPDADEYTPPYTLVLSLDDMLVHMDWTKEHGWRIAKRPGIDHFLAYMASMYEVVIFTSQPSHSGMLVMERLDPLEFAPYRLFKDHMRNIDGKNYKDLTTINRDMSKVIMIDTDPEAFKMQPNNGVLGRPFYGDPNDNWIEQITEFLEYVNMMAPKDVRPWINTYKGKDAALEFNKWQDAKRKKVIEEWEEQRAKAGSWKSWIFGGAPADMENPPVPLFDEARKQIREHFAEHHELVMAELAKDRAKYEEEMKRQMKDMTMWKMMTQMLQGPEQPPDTAGQQQPDQLQRQQQNAQVAK
ncbi:mitochondrial inner membrane protein required for protein import [Coemansia guatemalensis]|uniref:Mitochondrial import inner membrane translocase subunit TIM50 n=1 Tax=Coemansia guatemalensis TaxID=2761395 RepID=A0A9W8HUR5_9FUNG|nr:mitochondrial inner membrane protein required for protein import [Coemansia guatemalensis]